MDEWFKTWIAALESPMSVIDALGVDGCVTVSYGDVPLVAVQRDALDGGRIFISAYS